MMRKIIFLLFLSVQVFAQKGFYLRPAIERKFHANKGFTIPITTQNNYPLIEVVFCYFNCNPLGNLQDSFNRKKIRIIFDLQLRTKIKILFVHQNQLILFRIAYNKWC
jgi:hypothetical protein